MIIPVKLKNKVNIRNIIKSFLAYYKPYVGILILDSICALIVAGVDVAFPQILRFFTNDFFKRTPNEILSALLPIALILLGLYLIRTASQYYITR